MLDLNQEKTVKKNQTDKAIVPQSIGKHLKNTFQKLADKYNLKGGSIDPDHREDYPGLLLSYEKENFTVWARKRTDNKIEIVLLTTNRWSSQHHEVTKKIVRELKNTYKKKFGDRFYKVKGYEQEYPSENESTDDDTPSR